MLCTLVREPPDMPGYLYEVKWDGYRIIAFIRKGSAGRPGSVRMDSRGGLDYTKRYPPVSEALAGLRHDLILDGEVVVFNDEGIPDFDALQKYNGARTPVSYCIFDLLWMDGQSTMHLPLTERKALLKGVLGDNGVLRFSESFENGPELYAQALERNLEGIIAKKKDSSYIEGDRSYNWLKIPTRKRQEFVIGGWAESDKSRSFRSLLFGAYEGGSLRWIGRSGSGYKTREMPAILKKLRSLETEHSPFVNKVLDTKGAKLHWVKPKLVANFEFAAWTKSGRIRKPATFLGFRNDKKASEVVLESPAPLPAGGRNKAPRLAARPASKVKTRTRRAYLNEGTGWRKVDEAVAGKPEEEIVMEHCTVVLHDVGRELWKGVAKGDLILYYNRIAPYILAHLSGRPQSLNLKLTHAGGPTTFVKDMEDRQPACAEVFTDRRRVPKEGKRTRIDYLVCNNVETLIYMVDWGCVDINPWASRVTAPGQPDYIWLDLDPTVDRDGGSGEEDRGFQKAVETALAVREVLARLKITSFVKTSGKTGLHVYIPASGIDFTQSRAAADRIASEVHALVPGIATLEESIRLRGDKVYIDAHQNDYADTLAAPYSVRPYHEPLVSAPLEWKEVKPGLDRYRFNLTSIAERVEKKGELFAPVGDKGIAAVNSRHLSRFLSGVQPS
jgi:bifunctional non-homologous end joining protein LigD